MRAFLPHLVVAIAGAALWACAPEPAHDHPDADAGILDDAGPGSGALCSFNADCPDAERCGCTEADGCACETGARGTGVNGVDTCSDGNDCATSLCVEGSGGIYTCSGPCADDGDCGAALPVCSNIAFVGQICIRSGG